MNEWERPSYMGIGAPRYTVEDFALPEPRTDVWGWGCRAATIVAILFAVTVSGLGVPGAGLVLLGAGGLAVGVAAIVRGGLAWAWLPSSRGGVLAVVGSLSILLVAAMSEVSGLIGNGLWESAAAFVR